jgi:hypothetical protein
MKKHRIHFSLYECSANLLQLKQQLAVESMRDVARRCLLHAQARRTQKTNRVCIVCEIANHVCFRVE